jgi:hypothetical protein
MSKLRFVSEAAVSPRQILYVQCPDDYSDLPYESQ